MKKRKRKKKKRRRRRRIWQLKRRADELVVLKM